MRMGRTWVTRMGKNQVTRMGRVQVTRMGRNQVARVGRTQVTRMGKTRVARGNRWINRWAVKSDHLKAFIVVGQILMNVLVSSPEIHSKSFKM